VYALLHLSSSSSRPPLEVANYDYSSSLSITRGETICGLKGKTQTTTRTTRELTYTQLRKWERGEAKGGEGGGGKLTTSRAQQ